MGLLRFSVAAAVYIGSTSSSFAQTPRLAGHIQPADRSAVGRASVTVEPTLETVFADSNGMFSIQNRDGLRRLHLRVRAIGFVPLDVWLSADTIRDTLQLVIERVVIRLVPVEISGLCHPEAAISDSAFDRLYEQLKVNAEQYKALADHYPFTYSMVTAVGHGADGGEWRVDLIDTLHFESKASWSYEPGNVITYVGRRRQSIVHTPMLVDFASAAFQATHCFSFAGMDTALGSRRLSDRFQGVSDSEES